MTPAGHVGTDTSNWRGTLAKKGRWDAAVKELETLHQADPNAIEVTLELGEILCRAGKSEAALKLVPA